MISMFSCHIAFSLFPLSFPLLSLLLPSLFPSSLIGLPNLVSPFPLLGFLSRGVFHSSHRMESVLLLHVSCHYIGILLLLVTLSNCLVCSLYSVLVSRTCGAGAEYLEWSGITLEWKGVDNKSKGTTLALAHALCLDLLSCVWLCISGGRNCCQEFRRGVVYIDRSGDGY